MTEGDTAPNCQTSLITRSMMNTFNRRYDLIFVEMGRYSGDEVYWFIDGNNKKVFYTTEDIIARLDR